MTGERSIAIVRSFWHLMASNDFDQVASILTDDFILEWPQSKERIRGADRFACRNREYPAHGPWRFEIQRIVGGEFDTVSDVIVTDGTQVARAISFFTLARDRIGRIVEFWPEPYAPATRRAHLVESMD